MTSVFVFVATSPEMRWFPATPPFELRRTGMGPAAATRAVDLALHAGRVAGIISFGLAGGLTATAPSRRLLLPTHVLTAAGELIAADPRWHAAVLARIAELDPHTGPLQETSAVSGSLADKAAWRRRTTACALDMESGTLARQARDADVPFLALRVVVDGPDDMIPASAAAAVGPDGRLSPLRLAAELLRRPLDLPPLLVLARQQRLAGRRLAAATQRALPALRQPPSRHPAGPRPGGADATVLAQ